MRFAPPWQICRPAAERELKYLVPARCVFKTNVLRSGWQQTKMNGTSGYLTLIFASGREPDLGWSIHSPLLSLIVGSSVRRRWKQPLWIIKLVTLHKICRFTVIHKDVWSAYLSSCCWMVWKSALSLIYRYRNWCLDQNLKAHISHSVSQSVTDCVAVKIKVVKY